MLYFVRKGLIDMKLTRKDVEALLWVLKELLAVLMQLKRNNKRNNNEKNNGRDNEKKED